MISRYPKIRKSRSNCIKIFNMEDLFSCKMIGEELYESLEEQYNVYTVDDDWARKHDASPKVIND